MVKKFNKTKAIKDNNLTNNINAVCNNLLRLNNVGNSNKDTMLWNYYEKLSEELKSSLEVVNNLMDYAPHLFEKLDQRLKRNIKNLYILVKRNNEVYQYIDDDLKKDKTVIKGCLDSKGKNSLDLILSYNPELSNDRSLMLQAVKIEGFNLRHVPKQFDEDFEIAKVAIKQSLGSIRYISPYFQEHPEEIMKIDFSQLICTLYFANEEDFKSPKQIMIHLNNNKNVKFYHWIEKHLLKTWDVTVGDFTRIISKLDARVDLSFQEHLSYMMPYWSLDNIKTFSNKSENIYNETLKKTLKTTFIKEIERRKINEINMSGTNHKIKKNTRKLSF
jgi:hypothetical protein